MPSSNTRAVAMLCILRPPPDPTLGMASSVAQGPDLTASWSRFGVDTAQCVQVARVLVSTGGELSSM